MYIDLGCARGIQNSSRRKRCFLQRLIITAELGTPTLADLLAACEIKKGEVVPMVYRISDGSVSSGSPL